jgi:hypothetical protein
VRWARSRLDDVVPIAVAVGRFDIEFAEPFLGN